MRAGKATATETGAPRNRADGPGTMSETTTDTGGSVLVTGAGGVIGAHAAAEYAKRPGWRVRGVSRRRPRATSWEHLAVDLSDPDAARAGLAALGDVTPLVFAAYTERAIAREASEANVALLRNTLDGLAGAGAPLEHVTLYQGGKAYGAHMGFFNTPAKETDPRIIQPNFYYDQEDLLREVAAERGFLPAHCLPPRGRHRVRGRQPDEPAHGAR